MTSDLWCVLCISLKNPGRLWQQPQLLAATRTVSTFWACWCQGHPSRQKSRVEELFVATTWLSLSWNKWISWEIWIPIPSLALENWWLEDDPASFLEQFRPIFRGVSLLLVLGSVIIRPLELRGMSSALIVPFWWGEVSIKNDQNNLKVRLFFCDVDTGGHDMNLAKHAQKKNGCPSPGCNRGEWRFRLDPQTWNKVHNPGGDWNPGQGDNPIHIGGSKFIANWSYCWNSWTHSISSSYPFDALLMDKKILHQLRTKIWKTNWDTWRNSFAPD